MCKPVVYAHRGASGVRFENTMAAFHAAHAQHADGIELDVQLTADGIPVVLHDRNVKRISGMNKNIDSIHSSELSSIRIGSRFRRKLGGHRIPLLTDAISFCAIHQLSMNIELKETCLLDLKSVDRIMEMAAVLYDKHISSFHYELIEQVKKTDPDFETALLIRKKSISWEHLDAYTAADGFHFHKRLFTEPYLSRVKGTGKKIRVYGVTGRETFAIHPPSFVTGWITDYPSRFHHK